jgi:hypothetical protein
VFGPNAQVPIERLNRLAAEREYPRATALSEHGRLAGSQIDVCYSKASALGAWLGSNSS